MAKKVVAADASPLIGLAAAGSFDLLEKLFSRIIVTVAVRDEVLAGKDLPGAKELRTAIQQGWIEVAPHAAEPESFPELGAGEASTLAFALQNSGDCLVLMDDPVGRARAGALGVPVTGLAGLLLAAKQAGLIDEVRPLLVLLAKNDFRLSEEIVQQVLDAAGEA